MTTVDIVVTGECSAGCVITWRPMPGMRRITLPSSMIDHAVLCQVKPGPPTVFDRERPMTVAEIAAYVRVSRMTIYRACNDGALAHTRIGRQIRVTPTAVTEWLASS